MSKVRKSLFITLCLIFIFQSLWGEVDPPVYSLVEVNTPNQTTLNRLLSNGFDVIRPHIGKNTEIIAHQQDINRLTTMGFDFHIIHENFSAYLQDQYQSTSQRSLTIGQGSMGGYFTYTEVLAFVDSLRALYPNLISESTIIGQTIEGYDIPAYKLSDNPNVEEDEPEALIIGMHHAREGMSILAPLYFTQWLVDNYGVDSYATYIINERQTWIVPILNIDGYRYNEEIEPDGYGMFRKNKRDNDNNGFFNPFQDGVDLNRNYGYMWGYDDIGSSPDPSDETYRGTSGFSEPETQAIRDFCNAHEFRTALNYHTFGDLLIQPWAYSDSAPPDDAIFKEYALEMIRDSQYVYGFGSQTVGYVVNGDADDWMYGDTSERSKIISFTPEIGNDADYFWAPPDRIQPLAEENLYTQQFIALAAGPYLQPIGYRFDDAQTGDGDLSADSGETVELLIDIRNRGWVDRADDVSVSLSANDPFITIAAANYYFPASISPLTTEVASFELTIASNTPSGHKSMLQLNIQGANGYDMIEHIEIITGSPMVIFHDNAEGGMDNWNAGIRWGMTDLDKNSGEFSFTDSPAGNYMPNFHDAFTLANSINLQDFNYGELKFATKWHMEDHWDLAQLQFSTDGGSNWYPVASTHTTAGTGIEGGVQPVGQPVFNGYRNLAWLDETVPLVNELDQNWLFRFYIASDAGIQGDGWYIDDITVVGYTDELALPVIYNNSQLTNTDFTGPYPVEFIVTDPQGITSAILHYDLDGQPFSLPLSRQDQISFIGYIPSVPYNTYVSYYLEVTDEEGNTVFDPEGAPLATYSFFVTNEVQDIAVDETELSFVVPQGGTVTQYFQIENQGYLNLDFEITDLLVEPGIRSGSQSEFKIDRQTLAQNYSAICNRVVNALAKANIPNAEAQLKDAEPITPRELQLVISDPEGDQVGNSPDIVTLFAEITGSNQLHLKINFANPFLTNTVLGVVSLDLDQNMLTGNYPCGTGFIEHNIGSEFELIWDPYNQFGAGYSVIILNSVGSFVGFVPMIRQPAVLEATIPLSVLNNDDGNMDVAMIFLPSQATNDLDIAPNQGHGTIGSGGDAFWLSTNPSTGTIDALSSTTIAVTVENTDYMEGNHQAQLIITSNDPDEPEIVIPVSLSILAAGIEDNEGASNNAFWITQNYPNPFTNETLIHYQLPIDQFVTVDIFNVAGQHIKRLVNKTQSKGDHHVVWNGQTDSGDPAGTGIYFYRLKTETFQQTHRMVLLR